MVTRYQQVQIPSNELLEVECDVCHVIYSARDWVESQEFHYIHFQGGFGSVFGDGNTVECDICQRCLSNLLGDYLRIKCGDEVIQ